MTIADYPNYSEMGYSHESDKIRECRVKTSIIIVNYNGGEYILVCLQSLVNVIDDGVEIIVVDNASADDSPNLIKNAFPDIRMICSTTNLGFGGGSNLGVRYARGKYLAFLNPDTVVEPGWLESLVLALEANPDAGLATSKILLIDDPNRINTCGNNVHITGLTLCRGMGQPADAFPKLDEVSAISGAAFVVRRELFDWLGGFDENFFLYMEDTDLSLRARLAGYKCIFVPESIVYHHYALRFGFNKIFYQERNRYYLLLKHFHWWTLVAALPALLLAEVIAWGFNLLREPNRMQNKLNAYFSTISNLPDLFKRREAAQRLRRVSDRKLLETLTWRLEITQTGSGLLTHAAELLFNPLFALCRFSLLILVW